MVSARAAGPSGKRGARVLRVERHQPALPGRANHLQGLRGLQLDVGSRRGRVLLAPFLLTPARPELRQPQGQGVGAEGAGLLARFRRRRRPPRRHPVPLRARRHQLREPAGDAPVSQGDAKPRRWQLLQPHAARRGQPVAGGRRRLLRRGRRVPHVLPFPAHAPAVHVDSHGGPLSDRRHPGPDAVDPRQLPVGAVPPQPRRADARDGHRRRARLHVSRVHTGPPGAHQPRHSPAPRPAARQRPQAHRADERVAVLAPRHARPLLRRRDRDGRQHLSGRSQRRAHADAVERRPQRRLLARQPAAPLSAGRDGPRIPLRKRQRRGPGPEPALAAVMDEAADRPPQTPPRFRPRDARAAPAREPQSAGLRPPL